MYRFFVFPLKWYTYTFTWREKKSVLLNIPLIDIYSISSVVPNCDSLSLADCATPNPLIYGTGKFSVSHADSVTCMSLPSTVSLQHTDHAMSHPSKILYYSTPHIDRGWSPHPSTIMISFLTMPCPPTHFNPPSKISILTIWPQCYVPPLVSRSSWQLSPGQIRLVWWRR